MTWLDDATLLVIEGELDAADKMPDGNYRLVVKRVAEDPPPPPKPTPAQMQAVEALFGAMYRGDLATALRQVERILPDLSSSEQIAARLLATMIEEDEREDLLLDLFKP